MRALLIAAIATSVLATGANAQDLNVNYYGNAGVTQRHTDNTDTASLTAKIGVGLHKNFALEAEGGFGITDDTVANVKLKTKGNLGAYAVGFAPINDKLSLLGRVGYHHTWAKATYEASIPEIETEDDDGSFAAGVGAQYMFDEKNGIRGDYTRYTKDDGVDNFAISYVRKF